MIFEPLLSALGTVGDIADTPRRMLWKGLLSREDPDTGSGLLDFILKVGRDPLNVLLLGGAFAGAGKFGLRALRARDAARAAARAAAAPAAKAREAARAAEALQAATWLQAAPTAAAAREAAINIPAEVLAGRPGAITAAEETGRTAAAARVVTPKPEWGQPIFEPTYLPELGYQRKAVPPFTSWAEAESISSAAARAQRAVDRHKDAALRQLLEDVEAGQVPEPTWKKLLDRLLPELPLRGASVRAGRLPSAELLSYGPLLAILGGAGLAGAGGEQW